jgi:hypothetical protein
MGVDSLVGCGLALFVATVFSRQDIGKQILSVIFRSDLDVCPAVMSTIVDIERRARLPPGFLFPEKI